MVRPITTPRPWFIHRGGITTSYHSHQSQDGRHVVFFSPTLTGRRRNKVLRWSRFARRRPEHPGRRAMKLEGGSGSVNRTTWAARASEAPSPATLVGHCPSLVVLLHTCRLPDCHRHAVAKTHDAQRIKKQWKHGIWNRELGRSKIYLQRCGGGYPRLMAAWIISSGSRLFEPHREEHRGQHTYPRDTVANTLRAAQQQGIATGGTSPWRLWLL
jgi:hypothetical protein